MTNWKAFKIVEIVKEHRDLQYIQFELEGYIQYWLERKKEGESIGFHLGWISGGNVKFDRNYFNNCRVGDYLEIDVDRVKPFHDNLEKLDASVARKFGSSAVATRNAMINASSANPTALAVTLEGMDRVDRNEEREFEYKMEDNSGNKHQWIYRKRN